MCISFLRLIPMPMSIEFLDNVVQLFDRLSSIIRGVRAYLLSYWCLPGVVFLVLCQHGFCLAAHLTTFSVSCVRAYRIQGRDLGSVRGMSTNVSYSGVYKIMVEDFREEHSSTPLADETGRIHNGGRLPGQTDHRVLRWYGESF